MTYRKFYTKTYPDKPENFFKREILPKDLLPIIQVFEIVKPNFTIIGRNLWRVDLEYLSTKPEDIFRRLGEACLESQIGEEQVWIRPLPNPSLSARSIVARGYGWQNQRIVRKKLPYEGASKIFKAIEQNQMARFILVQIGRSEYVGRLQISLLGIVEDRRCPIGVVCLEGILRAEFLFVVGQETERVILGTNTRDYFFAGFTVKIIGVEPPKITGKIIGANEYKIDLYVFRTGRVE